MNDAQIAWALRESPHSELCDTSVYCVSPEDAEQTVIGMESMLTRSPERKVDSEHFNIQPGDTVVEFAW